MAELRSLSLVLLLGLGCPVAAQADQYSFDGVSYLCDEDQPHLQGYRDVVALNRFLTQIRDREIMPDMTSCTQGWFAVQTRIVQIDDPSAAASSLVAFARALAARSSELSGFESRYVSDAELVLQTAFVCDGLGATRENCLGAVFRHQPAPYVAESPVLCDFAPSGEPDPTAAGLPPAAGLLRALPFLCGGLTEPGHGSQTAWLARLSRDLFPAPMR